MIDLKYPTETDAFEDAVQETAYIARVDVRYGELSLPQRIRDHIADGTVIVHMLRGEDDVALVEATLTSTSKLAGIAWPDDVVAGTTVTVMCPKGAAGHDIAVLLPPLPEPLHYPYAEDDVAELVEAAQDGAGWSKIAESDDREAAPVDPIELVETSEYDGLCSRCPAPAVIDDGNFVDPFCRQHLTEAYDAEAAEELAADEDQDDAVTGELPDAPRASEPTWPGEEELTASETTAVLDAITAIVVPDLDENDGPGTVFSQALVAVRTPPRRAGWWERRLREAARLVLAESRTATRVAVAIASGLVLSGSGLAFLALAVTR